MCKQCRIQIQQLEQRLANLEAELTKLKQWRDDHTRRDDLSVLEYERYITPAAYKLGGNGQ